MKLTPLTFNMNTRKKKCCTKLTVLSKLILFQSVYILRYPHDLEVEGWITSLTTRTEKNLFVVVKKK